MIKCACKPVFTSMLFVCFQEHRVDFNKQFVIGKCEKFSRYYKCILLITQTVQIFTCSKGLCIFINFRQLVCKHCL